MDIAVNAAETNGESLYHVPSVQRALEVIEALAQTPGGNLTELAQRLELPKNSVFRILATLTAMGYVLREPDAKRYRLTSKLLGVAYAALDESGLVEKAWEPMQSLRDATGETVLCGTLTGLQGVVLELIPSTQAIKVVVDIGHRFPLHSAAPGKAMLAFLPETERVSIVDQLELPRFTPHTITEKEAFHAELASVRASGVAFDRGEEEEDIVCAAAPVFSRRGRPIAAIWITGPRSRLGVRKLRQFAEDVKSYAEQISARLGWARGGATDEKLVSTR